MSIHITHRTFSIRMLGSLLLGIGTLFAAPAICVGADTQSQMTVIVDEQGSMDVVDRWSGMGMESGVFSYFSATRELGVIPVTVRNNGFTIAFKTRSYLRFEEGLYYFVTPDFYYEDSPLDVELSLTVPGNLHFLGADPEPTYIGDGVYHWTLEDCSHQVVLARFERIGPFAQPGVIGPEFQVDPAILEKMSADELPQNADEALKELETIITFARAADSTDPDLLRVLDKLLAKFYYLFSANGLLHDYQLPGSSSADSGDISEEPDEVTNGILVSPADAATNK